jgi:acyl CoA:acetate/3-ketoacid CoA transferase beta subunit
MGAGMTTGDLVATPAEQIMVEISRCIEDGELVALGNFTLLAHGAACLAKLTHAPHATLMQESGYDIKPYAKTLTTGGFNDAQATAAFRITFLWGHAFMHGRALCDVECVSPAQIDVLGNTNTSVIGNPAKPSVRLGGGAGQGLVQQLNKKNIVYTTRHSKRALVEHVDFVTGNRWKIDDEERSSAGLRPGPMKLITNFAVFTMDPAAKRLQLTSLHPGVSMADVRANTAWSIEESEVETTEPPSAEELHLLRKHIDPVGVLAAESHGSRERLAMLRDMIARETRFVAERSRTGFGSFTKNLGLDEVTAN